MKLKYEEEILMLRRQLGQPVTEIQAIPSNRSISGEKRAVSAVEVVSAQDLGSLAKRHRELPAPLIPGAGPNPAGTNGAPYPGLPSSISLSQIAKQVSAPKRATTPESGPKQSQQPPQQTPQTQQVPPSSHLQPQQAQLVQPQPNGQGQPTKKKEDPYHQKQKMKETIGL